MDDMRLTPIEPAGEKEEGNLSCGDFGARIRVLARRRTKKNKRRGGWGGGRRE